MNVNSDSPQSFGQVGRNADYIERGYKRMPAHKAAWKQTPAEKKKIEKEQAAGLNALNGMRTAALVVPAAGGKRSKKIQGFLGEAAGADPKILGEGAYGTAMEISVTPALAAALSTKGGLASIGLTNVVPARGSPQKLKTGTKIVLKLAKDEGPRVAQAVKELRVHAYLADPTVKTPGMPNSASYVPAYYGGGTIPGTSATVTFMGLVGGKTLYKTSKVTAKQASRIERAYVSLWARGIYHADAHSGNLMFDAKGNPRVIDFGFAVVLPTNLVPKTYAEALSVGWARRTDAFVQAVLVDYSFHNPNTLALKMLRSKMSPKDVEAMRRRRSKFVPRGLVPAAKRKAVSPASGAARPPKKIDWGSASTIKKSAGPLASKIDWGSSVVEKRPASSNMNVNVAPANVSMTGGSTKAPAAGKRAASGSPDASGGGAGAARKKRRTEVRSGTVAKKRAASGSPNVGGGGAAEKRARAKPSRKPPAAPRPVGASAIRNVATPQIRRLKVANLKATLGGLRRAGYEIPAYSKLKKEALVGAVRDARAKEPLASSRKKVGQLRAIARGLGVREVAKMKRANVVAAIVNKRRVAR